METIFLNVDKTFQAIKITSQTSSIQTSIPYDATKTYRVFRNGTELQKGVDFDVKSYDEASPRTQIDLLNGATFENGDYVYIWQIVTIESLDYQFTPAQRITGTKLTNAFEKVVQRIKEITDLAAPTTIGPLYTALQKSINDYVTYTVMPEIFANFVDLPAIIDCGDANLDPSAPVIDCGDATAP